MLYLPCAMLTRSIIFMISKQPIHDMVPQELKQYVSLWASQIANVSLIVVACINVLHSIDSIQVTYVYTISLRFGVLMMEPTQVLSDALSMSNKASNITSLFSSVISTLLSN